ncbi:hypothetical protein F3N42_15050 [Marinihelvus fidelis]|uniref:Uncharacterized protein n=1 Tax=Marinihelvus fidelis TaxID=2613842 RepID=A0A5N0T8Q1_9GAMM|nr:hypothetical protein [Marinihelvus fidelis]KAA9129679.1 hypothetical protein F3N42_15050 [Marinihelvus fidelis]
MNKTKLIRNVQTLASYLFFGLGLWFFLYFLLFGRYLPSGGMGYESRVWQVLWELRGLVIVPAPFVLIGMMLRRKANRSTGLIAPSTGN